MSAELRTLVIEKFYQLGYFIAAEEVKDGYRRIEFKGPQIKEYDAPDAPKIIVSIEQEE